MPEISVADARRENRSERVRVAIREKLEQLGAPHASAMRETVLIRDGAYCGHRFQCDRFQAVWFIEENQIKFYGADGQVVRVVAADTLAVEVSPRDEHQRAA